MIEEHNERVDSAYIMDINQFTGVDALFLMKEKKIETRCGGLEKRFKCPKDATVFSTVIPVLEK
jgi:hypothetical protein